MRTLSVLCLLTWFGGTLAAQQASPTPTPDKPPLPPAPILHRAGPLAQWTITFDITPTATGLPSPTARANPDEGTGKKPVPHTITVAKSDKTYLEIETDTDGKRWEKWNVNGQQVSLITGTDKWIFNNGGVNGLFYTNYQQHDFPDATWVSSKSYTAFSKVAGVDCYIFHDQITLPESPGPVDAYAAIDSTTLWPVFVEVGGVRRTYRYDPAPSSALTPPGKVQEIFSAQQKALAPLLHRPGT